MLDEIFEMFQDRSRKDRGAQSGGLMGKIGRLLEGDSGDASRSGYDRRYGDRDGGYDDRQYGDRDRRFEDRPREEGYDPRGRGFASDERGYPHPDDRRFDARGRDEDREYRRDDDDDDHNASRNRKHRAFDFDVGDD